MACGMKGNQDIINIKHLTIFYSLDGNFAESVLENGNRVVMAEIGLTASSGMVRVAVGDEGIVYFTPRVYVEVGLGTIEAAGGEAYEGRGSDSNVSLAQYKLKIKFT